MGSHHKPGNKSPGEELGARGPVDLQADSLPRAAPMGCAVLTTHLPSRSERNAWRVAIG